MFSKTARTALLAVVRIVERRGEGPVAATVLAGELDLPANYLAKTLSRLVRAGILEATPGPGGGHALASPPDAVALATVVDAIDPGSRERTCLLGRPECSERRPCSAHSRWCKVRESIDRFLDETTLEDLLVPSPDVVPAGAGAAPLPSTKSE